MKCHIIYRSTWKDGKKTRPAYFTKSYALFSFIKAVQFPGFSGSITFMNDSDMPDDRLAVMHHFGNQVVHTGGIGNSPSYNKAIDMAVSSGWDNEDLILFQEDDYYFQDTAISELMAAATTVRQAHYFTLYDHPDRYTRNDNKGLHRTRVYWSGTHHWRVVESSCMSFAVRLGTLKKDAWVHRLFTKPTYPKDRLMWYFLQGIGPFSFNLSRRTLVSPVPSLSSHMETEFLAPGIDWETVHNTLTVWMNEHNLHSTG